MTTLRAWSWVGRFMTYDQDYFVETAFLPSAILNILLNGSGEGPSLYTYWEYINQTHVDHSSR